MKINAKIATALFFVFCITLLGHNANAWSVFGKGEKEKYSSPALQAKPKTAFIVPREAANFPRPVAVPKIRTSLTKEGGSLLGSLTNERKEMLRNLLINLYAWNKDASERVIDSRWVSFTKSEFETPGTPTFDLKNKIQSDSRRVGFYYTSLYFSFADFFDKIFTNTDGSPVAPGYTKQLIWNFESYRPELEDNDDPWGMSEEELIAWTLECNKWFECRNYIPLLKYILFYNVYIVSKIGDWLENPTSLTDNVTIPAYTVSWSYIQGVMADHFSAWADLWKNMYESSLLFNEPMPTE